MPATVLPALAPVTPAAPPAGPADGVARDDDAFSRALADARGAREADDAEAGPRDAGAAARPNGAPRPGGAGAAGRPAAARTGQGANPAPPASPSTAPDRAAVLDDTPATDAAEAPADTGTDPVGGEPGAPWLAWLRLGSADAAAAGGAPAGRAQAVMEGAGRGGRAAHPAGLPGAVAGVAADERAVDAWHAEASARSVEAVASAAAGAAPSGSATAPPAPSALPAAPEPAAAAGAAPAEARLGAPLASPEFASQFGTQVALFVRQGVQHARLQLNPAELGPVQVQITLDGSAATVQLVADQALTRQALEQAMPVLAGSLREAGLTLAGGGVFEQPRERPARDHGGRGTADAGAGDAHGREAEPAGVTPVTARRRGVVDLVA
jgi:flagellar hook-length control protein FliK